MAAKLSSFFGMIGNGFRHFFTYFLQGDMPTKLSYLIMGAGCFLRGQIVKGLLYLAVQAGYILFLVNFGAAYVAKLDTLGDATQTKEFDPALGFSVIKPGDNSMLILLYGVFSLMLGVAVLVLYLRNIREAWENQQTLASGGRLPGFRDDVRELFNRRFHVTVLTVPTVLTILFTVVPLVFMILMAFTNYNREHQPPGNLFTWVGTENFSQALWGNPLWSRTFLKLFLWTMVWAFFATFLNYVFGILLALMINRKGVKGKKFWRTVFITTVAVPQFVSLLLISKFLHDQGALNNILQSLGIIDSPMPFLSNGTVAKVTVIIVNLWVGIPYTMLISSGVLMNIPEDLYEASKIDGASGAKQFFHITMPYMLQVTTPYLITQFVGNINNFNVIYLLTAGDPKSLSLYQAGETDLLVTWLYKLTVNEQNYALASTIGIFIFVICAVVSLLTYNRSKAVQEEDRFQ
ncbi:MAG: sugar ABC transporter permease [Lachnospiraceae bacterium]|nr:sugar ABC transporter permease [Lachnospiraceae bacterium]